MADKPTPFRHNAVVKWCPPDKDPEVPQKFGYCIDRHIIDPKYVSSVYEPGKPPPPTAAYWKASTPTAGRLLVVPELRGAILHPITTYPNASYWSYPTNRAGEYGAVGTGGWDGKPVWANLGFGSDGTVLSNAAYEPWKYEIHQNIGIEVGYYCPNDLAATESAGKNWLSLGGHPSYWDALTANEAHHSISLGYALAPPEPDEDGNAPAYGMELYLGCRKKALTTADTTIPTGYAPQYSIRCSSETPLDYTSWWWTLYHYTYDGGTPTKTAVAYEQNPGGFGSPANLSDIRLGNLSVVDLPDSLMVIASAMGGKAWVYTPEDGWGGIQRGQQLVRVFGSQGWFVFGGILFPATTTVVGPQTTGSEQFTYAGSGKVVMQSTRRFVTEDTTDHVWNASYVEDSPSALTGHLSFTITNNSPAETLNGRSGCRTTPIVYTATEIHETTYSGSTVLEETEIQSLGLLESLECQYGETGRGATASLTFLDDVEDFTVYEPPMDGGGSPQEPATGAKSRTQNAVYEKLVGAGRVSIEIQPVYDGTVNKDLTANEVEQGLPTPEDHDDAAEDDDTFYRVFTGYVTGVTRELRPDGVPQVVVKLADRSWLWEGDRSSAMFLPQPCGWDFREYVTLILRQFYVSNTDIGQIYFPDELEDDPLYVPYLDNGAEIHFDPQTSLPLVLDKVCTLCGMVWSITEYGDVLVDYDMTSWPPTEAPDFVLTNENVSPVDAVYLPVQSAIDLGEAVTHALIVGRDKYGYEKPALAIDTRALSDGTYQGYAGRPVFRYDFKPDDPAPNATATAMIHEARRKTWDIEWSSIYRDIQVGQVVEFQIAELGVPVGARFRITSKSLDLKAASSNTDGLCTCTFRGIYLSTNTNIAQE